MKKIIAIFGMSLILILTILSSGCVEEHNVEVKVSYSGSWSGCYGDTGSMTSVDGYGTKSYYLKNPDIVSAVFQKMDDGHGTLTVEIIDNGEVVERESTSATYGVVSVSHSFGYGGYGWFSGICLIWLIVWFIIWLLVAFWVYKDAETRGESGILWALIVLVLGIIGILIYFLIVASKPKKSPEELRPPVYQPPRQEIISEGKLYCPACEFGNREGSRFCKKCGARLN